MDTAAAKDVNEATPALASTDKEANNAEEAVRDDAISSTTSDKYLDTTTSSLGCDSEADFLEAELSISNITREKITENVEDIVQDLENLLGGSGEYFSRESSSQSLSVDQTDNSKETISAEIPPVELVESVEPALKLCEEDTYIVDSTVSTKTDSSGCEANAGEANKDLTDEFREDVPPESVGTTEAYQNLPEFTSAENSEIAVIAAGVEPNEAVLLSNQLEESAEIESQESTEVTTSQTGSIELAAPVEVVHDANQAEAVCSMDVDEAVNQSEQSQDTDLSSTNDEIIEAVEASATTGDTREANEAEAEVAIVNRSEHETEVVNSNTTSEAIGPGSKAVNSRMLGIDDQVEVPCLEENVRPVDGVAAEENGVVDSATSVKELSQEDQAVIGEDTLQNENNAEDTNVAIISEDTENYSGEGRDTLENEGGIEMVSEAMENSHVEGDEDKSENVNNAGVGGVQMVPEGYENVSENVKAESDQIENVNTDEVGGVQIVSEAMETENIERNTDMMEDIKTYHVGDVPVEAMENENVSGGNINTDEFGDIQMVPEPMENVNVDEGADKGTNINIDVVGDIQMVSEAMENDCAQEGEDKIEDINSVEVDVQMVSQALESVYAEVREDKLENETNAEIDEAQTVPEPMENAEGGKNVNIAEDCDHQTLSEMTNDSEGLLESVNYVEDGNMLPELDTKLEESEDIDGSKTLNEGTNLDFSAEISEDAKQVYFVNQEEILPSSNNAETSEDVREPEVISLDQPTKLSQDESTDFGILQQVGEERLAETEEEEKAAVVTQEDVVPPTLLQAEDEKSEQCIEEVEKEEFGATESQSPAGLEATQLDCADLIESVLPEISSGVDEAASPEMPESQKQMEISDIDMTPFMNQVLDAEGTESPTFAQTDSLGITDEMLGQMNETEPISTSVEYAGTSDSASEYINQEDLPLGIDESEMQAATQYITEDTSELDLACKSIQIEMVSEKEQDDFLQQGSCGTRYMELAPDESMSEQSIAIASIMSEMGGEEGEIPMLGLEEPVSLSDLSEPSAPFMGEKDNLDDPGSNMDGDPTIELRQPLTVEVEGAMSTEDITEIEEPSQSDVESLKTLTSENVHSILKIYNPEDSTVEAAQSDTSVKVELPSTTTEFLQTAKEDADSPESNRITSTEFVSETNASDTGVSSTYDAVMTEEAAVVDKQEVTSACSSDENKVEVEQSSGVVEDLPKCSNLISDIVVEKIEKMHSPKITIKPIVKPSDSLGMCSPKPAILKPEDAERESLKITLKSLLKSSSESHYVPERYNTKMTRRQAMKQAELMAAEQEKANKLTIKSMSKYDGNETEDRHSPKITIKPIRKPDELQISRLTIKPIPHSTEEMEEQRPNPKITIKPIMKPVEEGDEVYSKFKSRYSSDMEIEERHSPKITIKPIPKPDDYNSKLIIKPIPKGVDFENAPEERHSPKITIKPIKPPDDIQISVEDQHGAKVTIKPIPKDETEDRSSHRMLRKSIAKREEYQESSSSPRITIKPIVKPQEAYERMDEGPSHTFKLNIKPVVRPAESSLSPKITIKPIPKTDQAQSFELIDFEEQIKQERIVLKIPKNRKESERVNKIKVKLSKDHGVAQILPAKRPSSEAMESEPKLFKTEFSSDMSISLVPNLPEVKKENIEIKQEDTGDPLSEIPVFEIRLDSTSGAGTAPKPSLPVPISVPLPTPRKRGRPRKVPLEVREEFKDIKEEVKEEPVVEVVESSRPKRSCRGPSVRTTLGIKPRKPRGSGRGRGRPPGPRSAKKERRPYTRRSLLKESIIPDFDSDFKPVPLPNESGNRDVVIYEEETRMSADNSSRAQTPAKQVLTSTSEVIEESQSSIQSNTTTESGEKPQKARKGTRLEVHQEPEGEVISADKLAEYSWGGGGPYMLQEQVAQFLGIKSFKRKYPGIHRRPVDMQERDFIRESCLASEAMCDMGLTAVKREDILDIMYTDFQHKYEEYCKHQRDRQAKDVSNKQKALSLAASQEKNKIDIVEQAVQSAFQWNANFNKTRKEQRRACLDLQTFTVHYPKGKVKQINKPPPGPYPLALVPGQYSDYYKRYTPFELSKLPLNTVGRKAMSIYHDTEDSQSDGSGSDSDSSSSDSDSSYSGSSVEDCKMCGPVPPTAKKLLVH
ncbi:hypothetical protein PPYR_07245 [Photinus pyralis]|uniref:PHD finger protein 10 n=2 Tax=Photinus pyralis TaxID=7054 RepID=A0A5N4APT2_PHOPY|nr:uncharacterized protein LOC116169962 isoform X1 [Photinus pyralis]KAB0799365.1 hypothetical protein PPYR_07245 [Photinus pyralis]